MVFGILSATAAFLTIIISGLTYKYYMTQHARQRYYQRCRPIMPYMRSGRWTSIDDTAGNRHSICFTTRGTVDFVSRGNQITTVMSNVNGYSLNKLVDNQIRHQYGIPRTLDPEPRKRARPYRNFTTNYSPRYVSDNP